MFIELHTSTTNEPISINIFLIESLYQQSDRSTIVYLNSKLTYPVMECKKSILGKIDEMLEKCEQYGPRAKR